MKKILFILLTAIVFSFLLSSSANAEPRRVLLEFVTGTWCQWCPCGDDVAEQILVTYPNTIVLAYHGAGSDPWQNFNGSSIRSMLGFVAYPTGIIDRRNHPGNPGQGFPYVTYDQWTNLVASRYTTAPNTDINMVLTSKGYNSTTRELTATVNSTAVTTLTSQYKISFILIENNVVYPQTGNGTCPGSSTYNHKWIVRNMINGATGENINTGTWNANQSIPKTVTTTLDAAWVPANCELIMLAYKDSSALYYAEVQQGLKQSVTNPVGIASNNEVPANYSLSQNYPNPFNPTTNIKFAIPKDGEATLKIYNMVGSEVATYYEGFIKAGVYNAEINASDWASGVYFYTLKTKDFTDTKKMILVK